MDIPQSEFRKENKDPINVRGSIDAKLLMRNNLRNRREQIDTAKHPQSKE